MKKLAFLLMLTTPALAQAPGPSFTLSSALTSSPTSQTAVVTVTATDPAGVRTISIINNGVIAKSCPASPCTATVTWQIQANTPHTISATGRLNSGQLFVSNQIQYPY